MDLNSKINWLPGMEITSQTFIGLEEKLDFQQQIAIRAALGSTRMGLLPGAILNCSGIFVKNTFEIERLQCMALLPSGKVVDADEPVVVAIPMLFGESYYLTISVGDGRTEYEKDGVPYIRPHYDYAIQTQDEVETNDVMPLMHFIVKDGVFSIDSDYIAPCLLMSGDNRFSKYVGKFVAQLETITSHQNLENGDGKRSLLHYLFILKSYSLKNSVHDFVAMLQEIAQAINYYIISPHTDQHQGVMEPKQSDVVQWLKWFDDYLAGTVVILDKVVLEDNTIDYDALLRQAKAELYAQLHEELIVRLLNETKAELVTLVKEELQNSLAEQMQTLVEHINNILRPSLEEHLQKEMKVSMAEMEKDLQKNLYERLYEMLFEHLFNALYIPEPESEKFVPLI